MMKFSFFSIRKKWKPLPIEVKASLVYTIGSFVSKAMSIITVPIFTRLLTTSEIGVTTLYSSWYTVFYTIITLSLCSGSLSVAMLEFPDKRDQYESACLTLSSISAFIFFIVYLVFGSNINTLTTLPKSLMFLILISMFFCPALDFWYARQRYEYKYIASVSVSCLVTIVSAIIAIVCVIYAKNYENINLGVVRTISSGCIPIIVSAGFYVYIMLKGRRFVEISFWKYALVLSLPLVLHTLSRNVLDVSDRMMISSMVGQSETGIYGTIYSLALIPNILWNSINNAIIPTTFEALKVNNYKKIDKIALPLMAVFGVASFFVALFAPEVLLILTTKEYTAYVSLVPAIIGGVYFTALYNIYGNLLLYKKKTVLIMVATMFAAALNIGLNYIFIAKFGFVAAAYTTLASFMALALFQGVMVRITYKKRVVDDFKLIFVSVITTGVCLLSLFLYKILWIRYTLIGLIVIVGYIFRKRIIHYIKNKEE